jgi:hypothetical protein
MLPESKRSVRGTSFVCRDTVGLGLDLSTNTYKVVRFFHYPPDKALMGMEICTISETDGSWRSPDAGPPYPISEWQTTTFFKGSLFGSLMRSLFSWKPRKAHCSVFA